MKKLLILLAAISLLAGCAPGNTVAPAPEAEVASEAAGNIESPEISVQVSMDDIVYIGERFFVTETNHIWLNVDQYLGRVIRYEGMFFSMQWDYGSAHFVVRYTYGCCGLDGKIGFDVELNEIPPFPDNTWVQVTGVLEEDFFEWGSILIVNVISIIEMPERGQEFVSI